MDDICKKCGMGITTRSVKVPELGKDVYFHEDCWVCTKCEKQFQYGIKDPYVMLGKKPYHDNCARLQEDVFVDSEEADPICKRCNAAIKVGEEKVSVNGMGAFHDRCFLCQGCDKPITGGFLRRNNQPFHKDCK